MSRESNRNEPGYAHRRDLIFHFVEYRYGKNIALNNGDDKSAMIFEERLQEVLGQLETFFPTNGSKPV